MTCILSVVISLGEVNIPTEFSTTEVIQTSFPTPEVTVTSFLIPEVTVTSFLIPEVTESSFSFPGPNGTTMSLTTGMWSHEHVNECFVMATVYAGR